MMRRGAQILLWPTGRIAQRGRGMKRPVGVTQEGAAQKHEVRIALSHDCICLIGFGDQTHGGSGNRCLAADSGGKPDLEARADGDLGIRNLPARGNVNQIDAVLAQKRCKLNGFIDRPAAVNPVSSGDADKERQVGRPLGANSIHDFQGETDAIAKAATIDIRALVGERREELVEQVTVGGMNLDNIEAGFKGAAGGLAKSLDHGGDGCKVESLGHGIAGRESDSAGRDRLPAALRWQEQMFAGKGNRHAALAPGMCELNGGAGALRVNELNDAFEAGNVAVFPDSKIAG